MNKTNHQQAEPPASLPQHHESQPKSLKFLYMTCFWERFAFFLIQSILVLYMCKLLHYSDENAYILYAAMSALLYITPVIGGYIADRLIGYQHGLIIGALLLSAGYISMALGGQTYFLSGCALIICGNGFFKPNISTMLGTIYAVEDKRKETGITLFYLGMNVGGGLGMILSGILMQHWMWTSAFTLGGITLLLGLFTYYNGRMQIAHDEDTHKHSRSARQVSTPLLATLYIVTLAVAAALFFVLQKPHLVDEVMDIFSAGIIAMLAVVIYNLKGEERRKLFVCVTLIFFSIAFWALYQQAPMSLTLFIDRDVERHMMGMTIPSSSVWALNGMFIILLTPVVIRVWKYLAKINKEPSTVMKFAIGIALMGFGYLVLTLAAYQTRTNAHIPMYWVVISYALQTLGELFLSPIGLAMITNLAPQKLRSMMMGIWFYALAVGSAIAGHMARLASLPRHHMPIYQSVPVYSHAFFVYGISALGMSFLLLLITGRLNRLIAVPAPA